MYFSAAVIHVKHTVAHGGDTICALATAPGRAALAVVRISGTRTRFALETLAGALPHPRQMSLRRLRDGQGNVLDTALVVLFPCPASATGEDLAELHLHGGTGVSAAVMAALTSLSGIRLAEPGEFTRRAVLAGKLDLTEAEAIADLVEAETESQRRQAVRQLGGELGRRIGDWRERLLGALALVEADLDFSDEGDVGDDLLGPALAEAISIRIQIESTLNDNRIGERLRDGFTVVIAGPPNAGKSTLLNHLAGRDVAIVSPFPGTTRDVLEVRCDLGGLPITLIDTAGVRDSHEPIEREGIRRAAARMSEADLVLWLAAAGEASADSPSGALKVRTKSDLVSASPSLGEISVSALTGAGVTDLLGEIEQQLRALVGAEPALITRDRHRRALEDCRAALLRVCEGRVKAAREYPELLAQDLRDAVQALGRITGHVGAEEVLDRIFSSFCIGK
ncbi:tRNA uridine-5-carboxymethylaminomethyl(34) synthesis GTPase MnmE [Chelatococcus reniformis]|uniref:tRNA modification GTPase MnmE n=1 Tax=Chelatococcus reniformis TaxID=1494448 RepID=A0A916TXT3_9HYPH|nr:tRNA uridine-5-carboxymethylaminomethyl(34) synthesis GTPase MnmE [Chelatococcus reniformis]GGC51591.1 tRNA modification GTPase MnmE [Chelatococcus reniformis]